MSAWDFDAVQRLGRLANDLTALSANLEVLRTTSAHDAALDRAMTLVERMIEDVDAIVSHLRER